MSWQFGYGPGVSRGTSGPLFYPNCPTVNYAGHVLRSTGQPTVISRTRVSSMLAVCGTVKTFRWQTICSSLTTIIKSSRLRAGASTGDGVDATCVQIGLRGGRKLHPEGGEFIQFLFTKSETLDSCRFKTKKCARMHQILFQFPFSGVPV